MANNNTPKTSKAFNPSLGPLSPAKSGSGNFVGIPINAETLKVLQSKVTIGNIPFLKLAPRPNKRGDNYFFFEFLPPQEAGSARKATVAANDEI